MDEKEEKIEQGEDGNTLNFSGLVLAITALGYAIPAFTATANAAATKKKARTPKAPKAVPTMTIEERKEWTKNLPVVREQIPYSELLTLKEEGKVKHIIKHPLTKFKEIPDKVLVVMSDDRVVRTVLPPSERDARFWTVWDELRLEDNVIDAYSPAVPVPVVQDWAISQGVERCGDMD
ncbi:hypothetical protein R1flu_002342 [Riccia fluitans]|uniref:Uncharacterized protein n=1 Tax=Riccia fluitans TaxID=41844 RepID=A0ABD1Y5V2_9MARC